MPLAAHFVGKDGKLLRIFFMVTPPCSSGNQLDSSRLTAFDSRHSLSLVLPPYRHLCLAALPLYRVIIKALARIVLGPMTTNYEWGIDRCPPVHWGTLTLTMATRGHY